MTPTVPTETKHDPAVPTETKHDPGVPTETKHDPTAPNHLNVITHAPSFAVELLHRNGQKCQEHCGTGNSY